MEGLSATQQLHVKMDPCGKRQLALMRSSACGCRSGLAWLWKATDSTKVIFISPVKHVKNAQIPQLKTVKWAFQYLDSNGQS